MIKLTPEQWVEETKNFLRKENKEHLKKESFSDEDYGYIGVAVCVAEFVKNRIEFVFKAGTKFKCYKAEDINRYKAHICQISTYSLPESAIWINGNQNRLTMKEFVDGIDSGRFELIND